MHAIRVERHGGPEVLEHVEIPPPKPGVGELLVAVSVGGVNYADVYQRSGQAFYAVTPPFVPGIEGAGRVVATGEGVAGIDLGDRVVWKRALGSHAELVAVPVVEAIPIPSDITDELAAAVLVQGMTAHYLVEDVHDIVPGDVAVVHSASGGVGMLLTQMVKWRGGRVIAVVSTAEKAAAARQAGADDALVYDGLDVGSAVRQLTFGRGADVVYDAVGATTFDGSLASLRPCGHLVVYGATSGPVPPIDIMRLNSAGSVSLSRPSLVDFVPTSAKLRCRASEVLAAVSSGQLSVHIGGRYPLAKARVAYEDLEARRTVGKLLLTIDR